MTASLGAVALLTLLPARGTGTSSWFACLVCGQFALADAVRNVLLFAPLGVGFGWLRLPARTAFLAAALLSGSVELLQIFIPGRYATISDVVSNTLGCIIGVSLVVTARWWIHPPRRLASILSAGWASLAAGCILMTGYLLQPSYPDTTYYGQWTPKLGHLEWYRGKVLDARIGSRFIRSWNLEHSDSVRADLLQGAPIEVVALAGPRVSGLASLFSIAGEPQRRIMLIGPDGDDLVYRYRMRAADFRLAQPDFRIKGAMALEEGDSIRIKVWRNDQGYCIAANRRTSCDLRFPAGTGWRFLLPTDFLPRWIYAGFDILWVAILLAPFGFWFRPTRSSAAGGSLIIAVLIFSPFISGTLSTQLVDWIGGSLGMGIGVVLGVLARARSSR